MNHLRVLNVITLSALLVLTGCFGLMPESEADEQTEPEQSTPHLNWHVQSIGIVENEWVIYYSVYDPSMSLTSFGIDKDSDGIVDYEGNNYSGFISINLSDVTSNLLELEYLRIYDATFVGVMDTEVMFSEILVMDVEEYPSPSPADYTFTADDAGGDVTTGTEDNLVLVTMTQGSDINWAAVKIQISVDGSAPITCDNPGQTGGQCVAVEFGDTTDNSWSVGDGVTITESGQDLCSSGTCSVDVTIVDTQSETTIDESSTVAQ